MSKIEISRDKLYKQKDIKELIKFFYEVVPYEVKNYFAGQYGLLIENSQDLQDLLQLIDEGEIEVCSDCFLEYIKVTPLAVLKASKKIKLID